MSKLKSKYTEYKRSITKSQALEMIENIRSEFREILKSEVDWMDEASKTKADEKVRNSLFHLQDISAYK